MLGSRESGNPLQNILSLLQCSLKIHSGLAAVIQPLGLPLPLPFSICLSPGKDQLLHASWSFQSLPFLEGFLPRALWAVGIRDKIGSAVSRRLLSEGEGLGEPCRGSKSTLGTKTPRAHKFSPLPFCPWPGLGAGRAFSSPLETWRIRDVPTGIF